MNDYDTKLREGIAALLAKVFTDKAVRAASDKMEKNAKDNPEIAQHMNDLKDATDSYIKTLRMLCKKYPSDSRFCKELQAVLAKQGKA